MPPQPDLSPRVPFASQINIRIDDVEKELYVLISRTSDEESRKSKIDYTPEWAVKEMKNVLGCLDCEQFFLARGCRLIKPIQTIRAYVLELSTKSKIR